MQVLPCEKLSPNAQPSHNADNVGPYTFVSLIWMDMYAPPPTIVLRNISMTPK